ncbi:hypothetical protein [Salinicoccus sp. CNSTN-B1]
MDKFSGQQIRSLLEKKKASGDLQEPSQCMHADIVKCYEDGEAHRYVCMECGYADKNRAAFFAQINTDQQMG